jgi:hypothetical protein
MFPKGVRFLVAMKFVWNLLKRKQPLPVTLHEALSETAQVDTPDYCCVRHTSDGIHKQTKNMVDSCHKN